MAAKKEPSNPRRRQWPTNDEWIGEFRRKFSSKIDLSDNLEIKFDRSMAQKMAEIMVVNNSEKCLLLKSVDIDLKTVTLDNYDSNRIDIDIQPKSELWLRLCATHVFDKRFDQAKINFNFGKQSLQRTVDIAYYRPKGRVIEKSKYDLPEVLYELLFTQYGISRSKLFDSLDLYVPSVTEHYADHFHNLLYMEEIALCKEFHDKYNQTKAFFGDQAYRNEDRRTVRKKYRKGVYDLQMTEVFEKRPSLQAFDKLRVRKHSEPSVVYDGTIIEIKANDLVVVEFGDDFVRSFDSSAYFVEFYIPRQPYIREHFALDLALDIYGREFLMPEKKSFREKLLCDVELNDEREMRSQKTGQQIEWFNANLNEFQKQGVVNALRADLLNPHLIFGPPGTGKTTTLCEIILQILKNVENSNIIITTQSNSAANVITKRLLQSDLINPFNFLRLISHRYSFKNNNDLNSIREVTKTLDELVPGDDVPVYKRIEEVKSFRIVIGTSSCVATLLEGYSLRNYFTHAVVDEAGQCTEFGVLIPMCLVGRGGQVIMAGDPMQMPPLIFCQFANERGLSVSMFSRLLDSYRNFENSVDAHSANEFDPRLVTKLRYNYRSLPSILDYYNKQFYNSELIPCIKDRGSREASTLAFLREVFPVDDRSAGYGIFFVNVDGKNERRKHSWCNLVEVKTIREIVQNLLYRGINEERIGLITPYAWQTTALEQCFGDPTPNIKVGTVDDFQGLERDVIIISTVRTCVGAANIDIERKLGFVKCPKRINVATSRARLMVIVVGKKQLLLMDENWKALIDSCTAHGTAITI